MANGASESATLTSSAPRIVAITGASGLIGSRLVTLLRDTEITLRLLTRRPAKSIQGVTFVQGDMTDAASLRELVRGATEVVHLAGVAHTELRTDEERRNAYNVNVEGTRRLIEAAEEAGVRRILITSSAHVYAGQEGIGLTEHSPTLGDSIYGAMKLETESAAREAMARGTDVLVIRPCITYGPGVRFNLNALMRAVRRGYYVHPKGADALRSFLSVDTAASAIVHLMAHGKAGETYNLADRNPVYLSRWVNDLADCMGVRHPRAVPIALLRAAAFLLTPAAKMGLPVPLTQTSLRKLTAPFSLDTSALASTGFAWPESNADVMNAMVVAAVS